jgi:hypothetical protein
LKGENTVTNKTLIPFGWLPGHWGLKGKTRARARAEYELTGLELDLRLAEIEYDDVNQKSLAQLDAKRKHGVIDLYDYDVQYNTIRLEGDPLLAETLLDIDLKHNKISKLEHDRKLADLRGEPWVSMPDIKWDPNDPSKSYFELDYNDSFVTMLRGANYQGATDEAVVERWLNDVCRSVAAEMAMDDPAFVQTATPVNKRRQPKKRKTEYS